jgi:hypothetical protein
VCSPFRVVVQPLHAQTHLGLQSYHHLGGVGTAAAASLHCNCLNTLQSTSLSPHYTAHIHSGGLLGDCALVAQGWIKAINPPNVHAHNCVPGKANPQPYSNQTKQLQQPSASKNYSSSQGAGLPHCFGPGLAQELQSAVPARYYQWCIDSTEQPLVVDILCLCVAVFWFWMTS